MDTQYLKGKHAAFYYYGREHLYVNIAYKIKDAQKSNEKILLCMERNEYNSLLRILEKEFPHPVDNIEFLNMIDIIEKSKISNENIQEFLKNLVLISQEKGYQSTCIIGICSLFINEASFMEFLDFEDTINKTLQNLQLNIICAYDIEDYMNNRNVIDEKVMKHSRLDHKYLYTNFSYVNMVDVFKI